MKKQLHLIVSMLLCLGVFSVSYASAWDAPKLKGSVPSSGTKYYVYNVGLKGFLNRGGTWATQAVLTSSPNPNASNSILMWNVVNTTGSEWTFQYNVDGSNANNHFLFAANADPNNGAVFTDNSLDNTWDLDLIDETSNIYTIQVLSTYGGYNATQFLGVNPTVEGTNRGYAHVVKYNRDSGDDYTHWIFVSQDDFELYQAKVELNRYLTYAAMIGKIDLEKFIDVYNSDNTLKILEAVAELLSELAPVDVTNLIDNPSFETSSGGSISGWTNNGFNSNNSDVLDPYKDGNRFVEQWVSGPNNLAEKSITQQLTGLPNGIYGLVASAHAYQQAGSNPYHTGAFVTANDKATEVSVRGDYFVDFIEVKDEKLTIGYKTQALVACNWTAFDNFRLYQYAEVIYDEVILDVSESNLVFDEVNTERTFTVSGYNLIDDIEFSAPAGISFSPSKVTPAEAQALGGKLVTVTWNPAVLGTKLDGQITVSSPDADSKTIDFITSKDSECADFLAPAKNLIDDPFFNNASQPGWGNHIRTSEETYCGAYVGKVWATRGGSIDRPVTWKPETAYIIRAYVNTSGEGFVLGLGKAWVEGQKDHEGYNIIPDTEGEWQLFENSFITGADAGSEAGLIWFNNYASGNNVTGYIDNMELYEARIVSFETGDGSPIDPIYVVKDEKLAEPETKKLGYLVKAWFTEEEFENEWDFETNVVNNNITLYAKWVVDPTTGINTLSDKIVKTEYFSLSGTQLDKINQDGLYIIKHIYNSGRTAILKQYIKLVK